MLRGVGTRSRTPRMLVQPHGRQRAGRVTMGDGTPTRSRDLRRGWTVYPPLPTCDLASPAGDRFGNEAWNCPEGAWEPSDGKAGYWE